MIDLVGQRNENFLIKEYSHYDEKYYKHFWKCECKCGNIVTMEESRFKRNHTKNCNKCRPVNRSFNQFNAKIKDYTTHLLITDARDTYEANQKENGKESNCW